MLDKLKIWRETVETLDKGGMTKNPLVLKACQQLHENGYTKPLERLLKKYPQILITARRNILEQQKYPFWPPPYKKRELEKLQGKYDIALINNNGDKVYLSPKDLIRIFFICGGIGSGKSYPLLRLLLQILSTPVEQRGFNVLIIQAVKRDADFLLRHNKDLIILEWEDIRRSPLYVEDWNTQKAKDKSFIKAFSAVNWHLKFGETLITALIKMCRNTFGNKLNFTQLYDNVEAAANLIGLGGRSYKDVIDSVKFSLYAFKETEKVLDGKRGLTISEFFTKKDIILNVEEETNDYLLMTFMIDLLSDTARYHRFNSPSNTLNTLVCGDECRRIIPPSQKDQRTGHDPGAPVKDLITSSREDGMGYALGTQEISSVPEYLISNAAYKIAMLISGKGRKDVQENFNLTKEEAAFMDKFPKHGTGIMSYTGFDRRFLVNIPSDLDDTNIPPNKVREMMKDKIALLHEPIDKANEDEIKDLKEKQEQEIQKKQQKKIQKMTLKQEKKRLKVKLDSINIIEVLGKNPFIHFTGLRNYVDIPSPDRIRVAVDYLIQEGLAVSIKCISEKGKPDTEYIALADKVMEYTNSKIKIINPVLFKHTLYQHRVAFCLKTKGYKTTIEYSGGEKTKKSKILKRIDVFAVKDDKNEAFEITLSFSNLIDNIHKCLEIFKVDDMHIVTENEQDQTKAMNMVNQKVPPHLLEKLTFNTINEFKIKELKTKK